MTLTDTILKLVDALAAAASQFTPRPLVAVCADGILHDSQLSASWKAGFPVAAFAHADFAMARERAANVAVPQVFGTINERVAYQGFRCNQYKACC